MNNILHTVRSVYFKCLTFLNSKPYLKALLVFSFFFLIFTWMYFSVSPLVSGDDHFFHIRFAEVMREKGFFTAFWDFKSLYFSKITESQYFVYYNFLFYLVLIPFTYITPLYLGIKLYAVTTVALAYTIVYLLLRRFHISYAFLWVIAMFSILGFLPLFRLFLTRPYVLAPIFLLLLLYALHKKKPLVAFIISFIYLYWHSVTFFFPIAVAVIYYAFERFYAEKGNIKNVLAVVGGVVASVAISYLVAPGFLLYSYDVYFGIYWETIIGKKVFIPEGAELYPTPIFEYINTNILIFSLFVITICSEVYTYIMYKKGKVVFEIPNDIRIIKSTLFFLVIGFFLGIIVISTRFSDYFVFFVSIYLVLSLSTLVRVFQVTDKGLQKFLVAAVLIIVGYLFIHNVLSVQSFVAREGAPVESMQGVGTWLRNNTEKGDIVFNPTWNWFTQLYYHSPDNYYIAGLEPRYMYVYDEELYWLWLNISNKGYACAQERCPELEVASYTASMQPKLRDQWIKIEGDKIADILLHQFKSKYIISSREFLPLNIILENSKHFKRVYGEGKAYMIYTVTE